MQGTDRGRFSNKTRNGNWFEEMVLEDEKMREFLEKKERGELTIQRIRQNVSTVEMSPQTRGIDMNGAPSDGLLHYGSLVRIKNGELECCVACDPGDAENVEEGMFAASGSRQVDPTSRNVWVLQKMEENNDFLPSPTGDGGEDDVVRYGDTFSLSTTGGDAFYLASTGVDWAHFSRISRKQVVYSTQQKNFKCMWKVDSVGRNTSFDMEGEPIRLNAPVLIKHCSTGSPLAAREAQVLNDYGSEFELVAAREPGRKMIWKFATS